MLEVGDEEPDSVTKNQHGRWRSRVKEGGAAHATQKSMCVDGKVDHVPWRYSPKGQRCGNARVGVMVGKTLGQR